MVALQPAAALSPVCTDSKLLLDTYHADDVAMALVSAGLPSGGPVAEVAQHVHESNVATARQRCEVPKLTGPSKTTGVRMQPRSKPERICEEQGI